MYHYPIAIEPADPTHSFGVIFPDLPGCYSAGDTLDEALNMAREALEGHLECLAEDGEEPPKPSSVSEHYNKAVFRGHTWALVSIDPFPYMGKSQKINVSMPGFLLKKIGLFIQTHPEYKDRSRLLQIATTRLIDETESHNLKTSTEDIRRISNKKKAATSKQSGNPTRLRKARGSQSEPSKLKSGKR